MVDFCQHSLTKLSHLLAVLHAAVYSFASCSQNSTNDLICTQLLRVSLFKETWLGEVGGSGTAPPLPPAGEAPRAQRRSHSGPVHRLTMTAVRTDDAHVHSGVHGSGATVDGVMQAKSRTPSEAALAAARRLKAGGGAASEPELDAGGGDNARPAYFSEEVEELWPTVAPEPDDFGATWWLPYGARCRAACLLQGDCYHQTTCPCI